MNETFFNRIVRNSKISTASISISDLKIFAKLIHSKNCDAISLEQTQISGSSLTLDEISSFHELIPRIQRMTIFINGSEGENLLGYEADIFDSHLLPTTITDITIETQTFRQVQTKSDPPNFVRLHFDFARFEYGSPRITPAGTVTNNSIIQVQGVNEAWVTSTFKAIADRLLKLSNRRSPIHRAGTYQLGLVLIAFPTLLLLIDHTYRSHQVFFDEFGLIVRIGLLTYAFLFGVLAYRIFYNYALWTFPAVDLIDDRDRSVGHRKVWFSVVTSFVVGLISYYLYKK